MLKVEGIVKSYDGRYVLKDVSFELNKTGFVSIVGESGSGKTTLLNIIGTLEEPDKGSVYYGSKCLTNLSEDEKAAFRANIIGFVFQEYNLIEDETVIENLRIARNYDDNDDSAMMQVLDKFGIAHLDERVVNTLSGGERQRVAIARALYKGATILLVDEPTAHLDQNNTNLVMEDLKRLSKDILVICVTHDTELALHYSDMIITLDGGEVIGCDTISENIEITTIDDVNLDCKEPLHFTQQQQKNYLFRIFKNNKRRVIRYAIITLLGMIMLGITLTLSFIRPYNILASSIRSEGLKTYKIQRLKYEGDLFYYDNVLLSDELTEFSKRGFPVLPFLYLGFSYNNAENPFYHTDVNLVFGHPFKNSDLQFGQLPNDDFDIVITDYLAEVFIYSERFPGIDNIQDLVDQEYTISINGSIVTFTIRGIIKTNALVYRQSTNPLVKDIFDENKKHYYGNLYTTSQTYQRLKEMINVSEVDLLIDDTSYLFTVFKDQPKYKQYLITDDKSDLEQDEVYVSTLFIYLTTNYNMEDIYDNPNQILQELNWTFTYSMGGFSKDFKIKGIIDEEKIEENYHYIGLIVHPDRIFDFTLHNGIMGTDEMLNQLKQVNQLSYNFYTQLTFYETIIQTVRIISIIGTFLFVLLLVFFISSSLTYNFIRIEELTRRIAILSSLGYRRKQLYFIIDKENLILLTLSTICFTILSFFVNLFSREVLLFKGLISISTTPISSRAIIGVILIYIFTVIILIRLVAYKKLNKHSIIKLYKESFQ